MGKSWWGLTDGMEELAEPSSYRGRLASRAMVRRSLTNCRRASARDSESGARRMDEGCTVTVTISALIESGQDHT